MLAGTNHDNKCSSHLDWSKDVLVIVIEAGSTYTGSKYWSNLKRNSNTYFLISLYNSVQTVLICKEIMAVWESLHYMNIVQSLTLFPN